jgi:hypothetical protein
MVLGHKKGLELVNTLDNTECLIVVKSDDGTLIDYYSKGFIPQRNDNSSLENSLT